MSKLFQKYILAIFCIVSLVLYGLTIRGNTGVPNEDDITYNLISEGEPFETSQERSRYATILALYHEGKFNVDKFPQMGTPDVGYINGHYYSFFPPAVSVLALPLYIVGLKIGATQLMVFLVSTIFALATGVLLYKYAGKIGLTSTKAAFVAFGFLFATNAWGYSVTLYAHLISAFFILTGAYILEFFKDGFKKGFLIWLLFAIAVFVDFPNIFLYFPIAFIYSLKFLDIHDLKEKVMLKIRFAQIITPMVFLLGIAVYGYFNYTQFGSATTLSNNLPRVRNLNRVEESVPELGRNVTGALNTRGLVNGYYTLLISPDRGILVFSPIVLFSLAAFFSYREKYGKRMHLLVGIPFVCLSLYAMFSDPWGGWAFGSRYMIASLPFLMLGAGIWLSHQTKLIAKLIFSGVFLYSAAISLLAPLTTNVIPPVVEARNLGLESTYLINWRILGQNRLASFVYNNFLKDTINAVEYYIFLLILVLAFGMILIWSKDRKEEN